MKKLTNYILSLLLLTSIILVGCKDDEADCTGGAAIEISSLNIPSQIQTGAVTISGVNLSSVEHVFVGTLEAEVTDQSDQSLTFNIPLNASLGENEITLASLCGFRATEMVNVEILPEPLVNSLTPWVPVGEQMTIMGTSLENNVSVTIDGIEAPIVSTDGFTMVVTVPNGVSTSEFLDVVVTNDFGSFESPIPFMAVENLLSNGTLTESNGDAEPFAQWEILNGTGISVVEGDGAFNDGRSMYVEPPAGNPWNSQFASAELPLVFGEQYTVLWWARGDAAGAEMRISASQFNHHGSGSDYFYSHGNDVVGFEIAPSGWQPYSATFTVGADLPSHKVVFDMGRGSVPFAIDHIALIEGALGDISAGAPNLVMNSGFEDELASWEAINGDFSASNDALCGTNSITATGIGGDPWNVQLATNELDMMPGNDYEISFWAKAGGPDGFFRISMSQYNGGDGSDFFYSDDLQIPEEWTYFSFVLEDVPDPPSGIYRLLFDMGSTAQSIFLDEVSVREYEYSSGLVTNGGFEDDTNGWESINGDHVISSDAHSGSSSMMTTGIGGDPWNVQLATNELDMTAGNDYKISFWSKAGGPDAFYRISMSQYNGGDGSDFFYSDDLQIPEEWTYFTFILEDVPDPPSGVYRLLFDMGSTAQTIFLDDVYVEEYEICE